MDGRYLHLEVTYVLLTVQLLAFIRLLAGQKAIQGTPGGELVRKLHYRSKQSMDDKLAGLV